ncbi:hypothetical protein ACIBCO_37980 [Streptomyces violascens]|uniref:hypothetical protein n=1 Tax=Streptomyces violascens TaxID=67381 RepID=UPI0037BD5710
MNTTATPLTSPDPSHAERDLSRVWSSVSALLFLPAALVAFILTLTTERAGRCLTYGEGCAKGFPEWLFNWSLGLGVVAFIAAVAAPRLRVRQAALTVQVLAEATALMVILSHA